MCRALSVGYGDGEGNYPVPAKVHVHVIGTGKKTPTKLKKIKKKNCEGEYVDFSLPLYCPSTKKIDPETAIKMARAEDQAEVKKWLTENSTLVYCETHPSENEGFSKTRCKRLMSR